jgi:hypothetical protein
MWTPIQSWRLSSVTVNSYPLIDEPVAARIWVCMTEVK